MKQADINLRFKQESGYTAALRRREALPGVPKLVYTVGSLWEFQKY